MFIKNFIKCLIIIIIGIGTLSYNWMEGKIIESKISIVSAEKFHDNDELKLENECSTPEESFSYESLPPTIINKIKGVSWKPKAPVKLEELSYVKILYWGFDHKEHDGELIVHKKIAEEVVAIFKELYEAKFLIEKVKLIDEYGANDDLSMADNNTSAFCFREVEGSNGKLSKHSYGIAIDINTVQNPYIRGNKISPIEGKEYIDRLDVRKGMIVKEDVCYKAFKSRGWTWGGDWKTMKDYQHFQKNITLE
ncbi:M15 family metallopeptidase [Lutibacter sp. B2]|nr:M15 family metallopeptidase [Lutibacter sp. B2]